MFRYSKSELTLYAHDGTKYPLLFVGKGIVEKLCKVNHRFIACSCLQQMKEMQGNSETGYLAVHQLLSYCQAFCWLSKEKNTKYFKEREKTIQGLIPAAANSCSSLKYLPVSLCLQSLIYCLQPCDCGMWWYGQIVTVGYFLWKEKRMSCWKRPDHSPDCPSSRQCTANTTLTAGFVTVLLTLHILYIFFATV